MSYEEEDTCACRRLCCWYLVSDSGPWRIYGHSSLKVLSIYRGNEAIHESKLNIHTSNSTHPLASCPGSRGPGRASVPQNDVDQVANCGSEDRQQCPPPPPEIARARASAMLKWHQTRACPCSPAIWDTHTHTHTHTHTQCIYYTHTHTNTHIHINTYIHIYVYAYIYIYI